MRKPAVRLICAAAVLVLLACGAWAAATGDSLISLSYLKNTFIPKAVSQGETAANGKLQTTYDAAKKDLDALRPGQGQSGGGTGSSSDVLAPRNWGRGDTIRLSTGSCFLLTEGAASVSHNGAVVDVTQGTETASGARLTAGHRYLAAEDTQVTLTILSGAAKLAVQGSYTSAAAGTGAPPFYDVRTVDWFCDAVDYVCRADLFSGVDEHHFAPNAAMDRAMLMTVLYRMAGSPEGELQAAGVRYTDVADTDWYAPFVRWGGSQGITAGIAPGLFGPTQHVTREQVVVLLYGFAANYMGKSQPERADLSGYGDLAKVSPWAEDAFAWAVARGLVSSAEESALLLDPQGEATRAQMAVMLRAFSEKIL